MNRLPSPEEQQWLAHALKKLIAKRGIEFLDNAPLVEPDNDWFPELWSSTAAHGHRLAQRLLYYAGLGMLRPTLSAYAPQRNEDGSLPWDAGTAGWFAGIREQRARFGLHVAQFSDPEAAAGVLAHEVAHAWRTHHRLTVDDHDKEELLTDLTTIALGFGILSTNNTDRYRSGGTWSMTAWSHSSVGYLPPQAMAFALALWCAAREKNESKLIERHLEPNQRAYFREALDQLARGTTSPRETLIAGAPSRPAGTVSPESFTPDDPRDDEIEEPVLVAEEEYVSLPADVEATECNECQPEQPCARHAYAPLAPDDTPTHLPPAPRIGVVKYLGVFAAAALIVAAGLAWWRQNHVAVYFDNALGRPLTLQLDGETMPFDGRLSVQRALAPGPHDIVVRDGARELERLSPVVRKQGLVDALRAPRFYVYNAGAAGIYERQKIVYSTLEIERTTDSTLIGLTNWIEGDAADYLFAEAPASIESSTATRTMFHIPRGVGYRELAWTWFNENRVEDAVHALQKGITRDPCDEGVRSDLANLLETAGQHERAVAASREWTRACDGSIPAHRTYQNLLRNDHRDELRATYLARLRANGNAANHYLYGRLLQGEPAMQEFREAMRIDPKLQWPQVALAYELLIAERDAEAFALLDRNADAAPEWLAMAAVATKQFDRAQARLAQLDANQTWGARWILARAKEDWDAAKVLLAELERGQQTPQTQALRARLDWESNTRPLSDSIAVLRVDKKTRPVGDALELEDAFIAGRFSEAALKGAVPDLDKVYAAEAAILAGEPVSVTITEPMPATLVDAALGRIDEKTLLERVGGDGIVMRPHAWFALAVRAAATGDRVNAARLFRHAADRALDREPPYRIALAMARRYE